MDNPLKEFVFHFLKSNGIQAHGVSIETLPGDGSKRRFWRIESPRTKNRFILMANPPVGPYERKENNAYLRIGKHLKSKGVPIPQIYVFRSEEGWVIMEDLGKRNLQEIVTSSTNPLPVYRRVTKNLLHLQLKGAENFNLEWCCQTPRYDRIVMLRDESHYFRDAFLGNYLGLKREWPDLEISFDHLAAMASLANGHFFLYRDFQSRNILLNRGRIGLVDWQGGRLGPLGYDLASLIIDPYTDLSLAVQKEIHGYYLSLLEKSRPDLVEDLERYYPYLSLQRNLQILGAFAYLSKMRGKIYFEAYIPNAVESLARILREVQDPELDPLREVMMTLPQLGA